MLFNCSLSLLLRSNLSVSQIDIRGQCIVVIKNFIVKVSNFGGTK